MQPVTTTASLADQVRDRVVEHLDQVLTRKRSCTVALTGGSTPAAAYRSLSEAGLPWHRIHVLQTDDHLVPDSDTGPSWDVIQRNLLDRCDPPSANRHPMPVRGGPDLAAAVRGYDARIRRLLQGGGPDVVILGLGEDGHTASIFDGDLSALAVDRMVVTTAPYRGVRRMTLTQRVLAHADLRLVLACGAAKAGAVAELLGGASPRTAAASAVLGDGGILLTDVATGRAA
ncbi:6-phosphogluconolactonase [Actinoplanes octamycinicus]|uniref:6-phosphogluconolactonase n=1 Tax=Actinoplanes octamycinicus TaxID=135948 RepID=A0A7W7H501_9ACTN|nr:6-phosphogluconolactonase [Actinoplanes octamycinicus]MBB4743967.1 6-phosphogluconolactonase [Actinoplanes octamycinicus]